MDLTPKQQEQYEKELANYKPTGFFANRQVHHFARRYQDEENGPIKTYVDGGVLDVEAVKRREGLNDRQIPFLESELRAAGYLPKEEKTPPVSAVAPTRPTE